MAEKKLFWLQLKNTYFNQLIQKKMRRQENGIEMQVIYLRMMLLSLDNNGYIYYQGVYEGIAEELAEEFNEPVDIVEKTIDFLILNKLATSDSVGDSIYIPEAVACTKIESASAERMRRKRERDKTSQSDTEVTESDEDTKKRDATYTYTDTYTDTIYITNYQEIISMYNDTCVSFPKVSKLSEKRKKAIKARLNTYTVDDFKKLFEMAESSSFLKGQNNRNWMASFDWLICDSNMAKVLDGNYQDRDSRQQSTETNEPYSMQAYYDDLYSKLPPAKENIFE